MLNKSIQIRDVILALALILGVGALAYAHFNKPVIVFVTNNKLYSQFVYTKQLDSDLRKIQTARENILDSLTKIAQIHKRSVGANSGQEEEQKYYELKQKFDQDNENLISQMNQKIWKQLNQYVIDYGKEHKIDYIMGADGSGTVMYAQEAKDITSELIEYSNKRYNGTGK